MKIRLLSDLHHEFYEDPYRYINFDHADVLVIAGDLAVGHDACWAALKQFANYHAHVVYVPGNHEYYRQDMAQFDSYMSRFCAGTDNIHFLNPGMKKIMDVTFIGAALWTNFRDNVFYQQAAKDMITDFRVINNFSAGHASELHSKHIKYIKEAYAAVEGTKVIVTHFLPATECISPQYVRASPALNSYFANDYANWIHDLKDVPYWLFGHTHDNIDVTVGDTRLIANPHGYNKNVNYKERVVEV